MAKGKSTVSLRIDDEKIEELNQLAEATKRDRSFVINEAIELYLDVNKWQVDRIKTALKQADSGQFASSDEVKKAIIKWRN